jgi:aminopeptidase N
MKRLILLIIPFFALQNFAQVLSKEGQIYTEADTLRGSLRAERAYDVLKYHLQVRVEPEERYISGSNTITFEAEKQLPVMQIDLFENMKIDSIIHRHGVMDYNRKFNAVFVDLKQPVQKGERDSIRIYYSGNPVVAKNAPWDGGFYLRRIIMVTIG